MIKQLNLSLLILNILTHYIRCQLLWKDDPDFVFYETKYFRSENSSFAYSQPEQIDYSKKQFNSTPIVLVGIMLYGIEPNENMIDFQLSSSEISKVGCKLQFQIKLETFWFQASLVAIDVSQYPFNFQKQFKQNNSKLELYYEREFQFSSTILQQQGKKNVIALLRGFQSNSFDNTNTINFIQLLISNVTDTSYKIKILQKNNSISIVNVYFSILEFIESPNSIYGFLYKQNTIVNDNNCFNKTCQTSIEMGNDIISSQSPSDSYKNIFSSINKFYYISNEYFRVRLQNFSLRANNLLQFEQQLNKTLNEIEPYESKNEILFFYQKQCSKQNKILNLNYDYCIVQKYFNISTKIWSLEKPKGTYCKKKYEFYECFDCQIQFCEECTTQMSNSTTVCTKCSDNFYLFNGICQLVNPKGTYCQKKDNFYECFDCQIQFCDEYATQMSNSSTVCTKCSDNFYLFNGICQLVNPKGTYCQKKDNFYECFDCQIQFCDECTTQMSNLSTVCTKCSDNFYLFNGICQLEKPKGTYCQKKDNFYECFDCQIQFCDECTTQMSNSTTVCTKCSDYFYLFNGICQLVNPKGTYCEKKDDFYECFDCQIQFCDECTTQMSNSSTVCTKCSDNFYLFNGICQLLNPKGTYCQKKDNFYECFDCQIQFCDECTTQINNSSTVCTKCYDNFYLFNGICQPDKQQQIYQNITESKIHNTVRVSSKIAVAFALALPNANVVQQLLSVQKLNFLLLINIVYPEQLYITIKSLCGTHPLDLFSTINFISNYLLKEQRNDYIGEKFSSEKVQSSIIYNTSGIIILLVSLYLLHIPFFFTKENIPSEQQTSKGKIYLKNNCLNVIILLNELGNQIISFSIYVQIIQLVQNQGSSENFIWKIVYLFILSIHQLLFLKMYYDISHNQGFPHQCNYKNKDLGMDKIVYTSNTQRFIDQQYISKNFKILYLLIESTFIPFVISIFYNNHLLQTTFCLALQIFLCVHCLIKKPFKAKLDNVCWCFIFASLIVLGIYVDKIYQTSIEQNDLTSIVNGISIFIIALLYIIVYFDPLLIIIQTFLLIPQLIQKIKQHIQKRREDKQLLIVNQSIFCYRNIQQVKDDKQRMKSIFNLNFFSKNGQKYSLNDDMLIPFTQSQRLLAILFEKSKNKKTEQRQ